MTSVARAVAPSERPAAVTPARVRRLARFILRPVACGAIEIVGNLPDGVAELFDLRRDLGVALADRIHRRPPGHFGVGRSEDRKQERKPILLQQRDDVGTGRLRSSLDDLVLQGLPLHKPRERVKQPLSIRRRDRSERRDAVTYGPVDAICEVPCAAAVGARELDAPSPDLGTADNHLLDIHRAAEPQCQRAAAASATGERAATVPADRDDGLVKHLQSHLRADNGPTT